MTAPSTTLAPPAPAAAPRMSGRSWALLLVLSGTVFLEGLDVSMMGVALPSIRDELGMSTSALQWVVSAYVLGYGGFVLLGGRAADLLGRRRMFLLWLTVFIAFSGLGGLATEGWMLILARFATGVSAGFLTPASLSIITTSFEEGEARNRALLVYGGVAAGGFSLGMVAGGLLTSVDWRWVFFAPVLLASGLLAAAVRSISPDAAPAPAGVAARRFDLGGALSLTGSMLLLVLGVVRAPDVAWTLTAAALVGSLFLMVTFVRIERRHPAPLVRLGILRSGALVRANLGAMLFVGSFVGFQFVVVLYLQELREWSSLRTGLALMVAGVDAVIAPTVVPWVVRRFGNVPTLFVGMLMGAAAYATFLRLGADWAYALMLPGLLLLGLGFALTYGPLTIAATDGIDESEQGLAGGLLNASVQFGAALVLAVVTAVNTAATGDDGSSQALLDGYRSALVVPVVAVVVAVLVTAPGLRRRDDAAGGVPRQ